MQANKSAKQLNQGKPNRKREINNHLFRQFAVVPASLPNLDKNEMW